MKKRSVRERLETSPKKKLRKRKPAAKIAQPDRCRVCGCTEFEPCASGCAWSDIDDSLCTTCEDAVHALVEWYGEALCPNFAALIREYKEQRKEVLACWGRVGCR